MYCAMQSSSEIQVNKLNPQKEIDLKAVKVPKKRKLFVCNFKICTLKYTIPKFWSALVKIADFTNA